MISSTFLPPSLHLIEKTEIFPEFLHIQFLSPFPFPEATLPRPVCLLAGPPVAPLVGPPAQCHLVKTLSRCIPIRQR